MLGFELLNLRSVDLDRKHKIVSKYLYVKLMFLKINSEECPAWVSFAFILHLSKIQFLGIYEFLTPNSKTFQPNDEYFALNA